MTELLQEIRLTAAQTAKACIRGELPWINFIEQYGSSNDDQIMNLVDLIEHEPQKGGFFGVNNTEWNQYQAQIADAIQALESHGA